MSRKIKVITLLISSLYFVLYCYSSSFANENSLLISPEQLSHIPFDQRVVVDTRSSLKFLIGHIPGAISLPDWWKFTHNVDGVKGILKTDGRFITKILAPLGFSPKKHIIIYGEPNDPWRTDGRFFWMFEYYGFPKVSLLDGDLTTWEKEGLKVEHGSQNSSANSESLLKTINLNPNYIADKYLIKNEILSSNTIIIDNRTRKEFDGATPYGSPRSGHIPNAVSIHWPKFFQNDGTLKSRDDLQLVLDQNKIHHKQKIIVYCTGGVRSAMAYFVFRYLGYEVRNYDGSWWDWSRSNFPVEQTE